MTLPTLHSTIHHLMIMIRLKNASHRTTKNIECVHENLAEWNVHFFTQWLFIAVACISTKPDFSFFLLLVKIPFVKYLLTNLKATVRERKGDAETERPSIHELTLQMTTLAFVEPNLSQDSGTSFRFGTWVAGSQIRWSSSTAFPRPLTRSMWNSQDRNQSPHEIPPALQGRVFYPLGYNRVTF